jgi:protein-S-isoprenylcysteine O-methyltransferase Ste14
MDIFLVALQISFFAPVLIRAAGNTGGAAEKTGILTEIAASARRPVMVLHGIGLLLVWAGVMFALMEGRVSRMVTVRGTLGAVLLLCAALLMTWSIVALRSWRLLPIVDPGHELCMTGPYGVVRHPMYLALDLLGLGSAVWVGTALVAVAATLLVVGGDLRARREEKALVEVFGDRYRGYMMRVGRTIPFLY